MANNRSKHIILKVLKSKWDREKKANNDKPISALDVSLDPQELSKQTGYNIEKLKDICHVLMSEQLVQKVTSGNLNLPDKYVISSKGRTYVTEQKFLNQIFWRKFEFWKFVIPTIIAIIALLNSIFGWWETS